MSQRTALLVATALTVFVLVMLAGVVWQVFQKANADTLALQVTAPTQTADSAGEAQAVSGPTPEQIAAREAALQNLIQQANQRLEESNKQQLELSKELQQANQKIQASQRATAAQPAKYKVSPDQAIAIALAAVPGAVLSRPPELISFQGATAYEVTLDRGTLYIDANSGQVLYNSAAVIVVTDRGSGNSGGGGNANPSPNPKPSGEPKDDKERDGGGGDD